MLRTQRITAYSVSAIAIAFYFLFPEPSIAVTGAMIIQTIAFITVAGKSFADGLLLVGVSLALIGLLPMDHPLVAHSTYFENVRWTLVFSGLGLGLSMAVIVIYKIRKDSHLAEKVFHPHPK
jgi:hypothetical protein